MFSLFCPSSMPLSSLDASGVFLICWLPFFVTHILNTHCRTCYIPPGLYSAFTWLGYVNSALNPVIYTTFNIEFRRAFIKILSCWGRRCARKLKWKWGVLVLQISCGAFGKQWPQLHSGHGQREANLLCVLQELYLISGSKGSKKENRPWGMQYIQIKEDLYFKTDSKLLFLGTGTPFKQYFS